MYIYILHLVTQMQFGDFKQSQVRRQQQDWIAAPSCLWDLPFSLKTAVRINTAVETEFYKETKQEVTATTCTGILNIYQQGSEGSFPYLNISDDHDTHGCCFYIYTGQSRRCSLSCFFWGCGFCLGGGWGWVLVYLGLVLVFICLGFLLTMQATTSRKQAKSLFLPISLILWAQFLSSNLGQTGSFRST